MKLLNLFKFNQIMGGSEGFTQIFDSKIGSHMFRIYFLNSEDKCMWKVEIVDFSSKYFKTINVLKIPSTIKSIMTDDFMIEYQHDRGWNGIPMSFYKNNPDKFVYQFELETELKTFNIKKLFVKKIFEEL